jgi:hypothetical protein
MPPKKSVSTVARRSSRVAAKKKSTAAGNPAAVPSSSNSGRRPKATQAVSAARTVKSSSTKESSEINRRSKSSGERSSRVKDESTGQQLAGWSSVESSDHEEIETSREDVAVDSVQFRERHRAPRVAETTAIRHRSPSALKVLRHQRKSRSVSFERISRVYGRRNLVAQPSLSRESRSGMESSAITHGIRACASKSKSTASRWPADRDSGHARESEAPAGRRTNRHGSNRSRVASRQHIQASQISDTDTDRDADQELRKHGTGTKHVRTEQDVSKRGGCGRDRMVYDRDAAYSPKRVSQGYRSIDVDRHGEVNRRRSRSEDGLRISARRHYTVNVDDEPYVESPEYDREARRPPGRLPNREAEYHPYDRPPYAVDVKEFDDCHHS